MHDPMAYRRRFCKAQRLQLFECGLNCHLMIGEILPLFEGLFPFACANPYASAAETNPLCGTLCQQCFVSMAHPV